MKFKILKECVIEHEYYRPGDFYNFVPDPLTNATYIHRLLDYAFIERISEQPKTVWDLKEGDNFYFIDWYGNTGGCASMRIQDLSRMRHYREVGNCFLTLEECRRELARRKAKVILERDTKGFKPDWSKTCPSEDKWVYTVVYNHNYKRLVANGYAIKQFPCEIWFATEEDTEASIKAHPEEWKTYLGVEG